MKTLYEFNVDKTVEVEEQETRVEEGKEIIVKKKVSKSVPVKILIKKPNRSLADEGDLYYSVKVSEGIQKGLLTRALLSKRLINDGGTLIAINNAIYVSGQEYMKTLEDLCKDGYLRLRELIPVPTDFIGNISTPPITDPAPFNHSTKIAVLDVRRK